MGEHWRREWGCTEPTTDLIDLGDGDMLDRCPIALLRDAPTAWPQWASLAASSWDTGNLGAYIGPGREMSAAGHDAMLTALGAVRDKERAEIDKMRDKQHGQS